MKKLLPFALLMLFNWSCEEPSIVDRSLDQILDGKDVAVNKGMLVFRDQQAFDSFAKSASNLSNDEYDLWEKANNFKSLKTIHEEIIAMEDAFLESMNERYNGNENITRKDIGYTTEAQKLIDAGLLIINEFETLDLNVPTDFYARFLNKDGILRIGNEIQVPKSDFLMIIKDGDISKVSKAKTYKPGQELGAEIQIANVERSLRQMNDEISSRPANVQSCDKTSGSYRLIVYDEYSYIYYNDGSIPCPNVYSSNSIKLRSLKKILGTWQNHKTSEWSLTSNYKADHWGVCYGYACGLPTTQYFIRNIVTYTNTAFPPPYDHTWVKNLYFNYHLGPCESGGLSSCQGSLTCNPFNPDGLVLMPIRSHNATGKNGITCYVGD
jgi:hypothetical protein